MSLYDPYIFAIFLSSVIILVMGVCLLVVSVPKEPELRNYRISRKFLALAYVILAAVGLWESLAEPEPDGDLTAFACTVTAASYQAMLFTFSLITLINMGYVNRRRVLKQIIPISILAACLFVILFVAPEHVFYKAFYAALVLYGMQLILYIVMFTRQYKIYRHKLDNFFSENEERRMIWIKRSFYMAAGVGIIAVAALFVNRVLYAVITASYTIFYIYFAIKYISYVTHFHRIAPVVVVNHEPADSNANGTYNNIHPSIQQWIIEKQFIQPDITLDSVAQAIGTNKVYLSRYINSELGLNFKSWICSLRIAESQRLMLAKPDASIPEIGEMVGVESKSSFYRQFMNVTGMPPGEYRKKATDNE